MADETTPKSKKAGPDKPQSAIQVPDYADKIAKTLAVALDDDKKHVIGAAVLKFAALPAEEQVKAIFDARVAYRNSTPAEPAAV